MMIELLKKQILGKYNLLKKILKKKLKNLIKTNKNIESQNILLDTLNH